MSTDKVFGLWIFTRSSNESMQCSAQKLLWSKMNRNSSKKIVGIFDRKSTHQSEDVSIGKDRKRQTKKESCEKFQRNFPSWKSIRWHQLKTNESECGKERDSETKVTQAHTHTLSVRKHNEQNLSTFRIKMRNITICWGAQKIHQKRNGATKKVTFYLVLTPNSSTIRTRCKK